MARSSTTPPSGCGRHRGAGPLAALGPALAHLRWLWRHPFTEGRRTAACLDWLRWQLESRLLGRRAFAWVDGLRLAAQPGLAGVTANVGIGLAEPEAMGFLLHFLRPGELMVDVGANAGSYTLLAASRGARVIAAEPNPLPRAFLERSLALNGLTAAVAPCAVSAAAGHATMDLSGDATGHVTEGPGTAVAAVTLDGLVGGAAPALVKIDVEGHEAQVLAGGERALARVAAAIVETWGEPALTRRLRDLGLEPCGYEPLRRRLMPRADLAGAQTVLFVRDLEAARERLADARAFTLHGRRY